MDATFIKALLRRGTARQRLGRHAQAKEDYTKVRHSQAQPGTARHRLDRHAQAKEEYAKLSHRQALSGTIRHHHATPGMTAQTGMDKPRRTVQR